MSLTYNSNIGKRAKALASQGVKRKIIHLSILPYKDAPQKYDNFVKVYKKDLDEGEAYLHERLTRQAFDRIEDPDKPSDKILQLALEKLVGWQNDPQENKKEEDEDKKTDIISKLVDKLSNEPARPQETPKGEGSEGS